MKFRQASKPCKRVFETAKLAFANKTKESITYQKLDSHDFWRMGNKVLNKGRSARYHLYHDPEVLPSESNKAKLFAETFPRNTNRDDSVI